MALWSPFVGVRGGLVRVVVGHSWVGAWVLLITCDGLVAGVLLSVWWWWSEPLLVGWGGLVGDMVLSCLGPGLLLSWVTSMVVVGGVIAAVGTSFGW